MKLERGQIEKENTPMNLQDADKRFDPVSNSSIFNRILDTLNLRSNLAGAPRL
jgi:hypothetical protein